MNIYNRFGFNHRDTYNINDHPHFHVCHDNFLTSTSRWHGLVSPEYTNLNEKSSALLIDDDEVFSILFPRGNCAIPVIAIP